MEGWMKRGVDGVMDGKEGGRNEGGVIDGMMGGLVDGWSDRWMDGWNDRWMDGWMRKEPKVNKNSKLTHYSFSMNPVPLHIRVWLLQSPSIRRAHTERSRAHALERASLLIWAADSEMMRAQQ